MGFDTNGVAGLVFYASLVLTIVVLYMTGNAVPATVMLVIMFVIPLSSCSSRSRLPHIVEKKAEIMPRAEGMFIVQGFFELFEVLLSYFSNTLSFVRVGAFAVSHAAMMEVVFSCCREPKPAIPTGRLSSSETCFVCGMEGLIVGIQVLRLEYYELFSRFYRGTGRAFKPLRKEPIDQNSK